MFADKLTSDCAVHHRGGWLSIMAQSVNTDDIFDSGHQACECHLSLICDRGAYNMNNVTGDFTLYIYICTHTLYILYILY